MISLSLFSLQLLPFSSAEIQAIGTELKALAVVPSWDSVAEGRQKTDAEYANDLVKFIGSDRHATVIIDPSAASFKTELVRRGIFHVDAKNDVSDGIRMTSMLLNQRKIKFCRETTTRAVQEMQSYAWDPKAAANGEEKPLKNHDHAPDALRYFVKTEVPYWRFGE